MTHYKLFVLINKGEFDEENLDLLIWKKICMYNENIVERNNSTAVLYDWYIIGGRWSGYFDGLNYTMFCNVIEEKYGCNILCLEDEIHINSEYKFLLQCDEENHPKSLLIYDEINWINKKKQLVEKYAHDYVVLVDCHI